MHKIPWQVGEIRAFCWAKHGSEKWAANPATRKQTTYYSDNTRAVSLPSGSCCDGVSESPLKLQAITMSYHWQCAIISANNEVSRGLWQCRSQLLSPPKHDDTSQANCRARTYAMVVGLVTCGSCHSDLHAICNKSRGVTSTARGQRKTQAIMRNLRDSGFESAGLFGLACNNVTKITPTRTHKRICRAYT